MKKILLTAGLLLTMTMGFAVNAADNFAVGFEDLPLMPGLTQVEDATVTFDTPAGRIIRTDAVAEKKSVEDITAFYAKTLPALGWKRQTDTVYIRENEKLTIKMTKVNPPSVSFELVSQK